ncbi:MAG: TlpA family protein disulfide reductase [Deltaproteobacteria bacterium]|nr:TlpA family protein disulfide reductase [Deltaproteobacteria bacterium]
MPRVPRAPQLLIAWLAICLAASGCQKREAGPTGDIVETLRAPRVDGAPFDPKVLRGKPTLVLFVSPTCPHCVDELPAAQAAAKSKNANVVAVFIAGKAENAQGVIDHTKFDGTALIDDGTLRRKYGIRAVPLTVVLGPDGFATEQLRGGVGQERLADALADAR